MFMLQVSVPEVMKEAKTNVDEAILPPLTSSSYKCNIYIYLYITSVYVISSIAAKLQLHGE